MLKNIKVLSFDLDDTLWPCQPTIIRAEEELFQWLSINVPKITEKYDKQQLLEKRRALIDSRPELGHDLTALRLLSFEKLAAEFELSSSWIKPAFNIFYEARQCVTFFDDVKPVLDELSKSFILVSLTNGNANAVKTGIDHWFEISLNSESVGKSKAEPDIYRHVQETLDIEAFQMVHIGDDPINDVLGAKSAGAYGIWLNREQRQWELADSQPDAIIEDLNELPQLLT